MKFATASEHRDFFRKHQLIEFDNLLSIRQVQQLSQGINKALSLRLNVSPNKINEIPPRKLFLAGRDLWRADEALKKLILQNSFAEIASELVDAKPVRIGYDQFFSTSSKHIYSNKDEKYDHWLHATASLNDISCLQGIICGLMLCLSPQEGEQSLSLFSSKSGNGVFFHPELPINFQPLMEHQDSSYLLIVYCQKTTVYCLQNHDPHTHEFKRLDYSFGDKLVDHLHPIIFR